MTTTGCTRLMAAATLLIAGACSEPPTLTTRHVAPATLDKSRAVAVGIGPSQTSVDAALVNAAHARCLDLHPYTVNDVASMKRLLDLGADGMFTNFLDRLNGLLGREAAPRKVGAKLASSANVTCRATK